MRKLTSVVIVVAFGVTALTGTATAGGEKADTTVTIKGGGEIFGYVKSPKPKLCAKERRVAVYKQSGNQQNPSNDDKIATDFTSKVGDRYQWSAGNPGNGKFYARARGTDDCKGDFSPTVNGN